MLGVPVAKVLKEEEVKSFLEFIQLSNHELPYSDRNRVLWEVVGHMDQFLGLQMQVWHTLLLNRKPSF